MLVDPGKDLTGTLSRPDRRSMVVASDRDRRLYISDGRRFVDRGRRTGPQPVSSATVIDELTVGIIWATTNADTALLADDAQLAKTQLRLAHYEEKASSDVTLSECQPSMRSRASGPVRVSARDTSPGISIGSGGNRSSGRESSAVRRHLREARQP